MFDEGAVKLFGVVHDVIAEILDRKKHEPFIRKLRDFTE
jgi:hypothetical protein